jgi:hypothetical protein
LEIEEVLRGVYVPMTEICTLEGVKEEVVETLSEGGEEEVVEKHPEGLLEAQ